MEHYTALKRNGQTLEVYPDGKNTQNKISNGKKKKQVVE